MEWTTQDYVYVAAECTTGLLSVLGNGLVLLAIARTRALRTPTNCFIGSLAAADVLVGILVSPTVILPYRGLPRDFHGCVLFNTVVVLITNISILNLLAVAVERFLAISDPFRYQRVMTIPRALTVVGVTWVVATLIGLLPTMGWNLGQDNFSTCSFTGVIDMRYMIYFTFFSLTLPALLVMLIIYVYIFRIVRKQRRAVAQLRVMSREDMLTVRKRKSDVRGAQGLAYVIVLFAVAWIPLHIMNTVTFFAPQRAAPYEWLLVAIVLSHANSFVNPFLYAFSNSKFKRAMLNILCCKRTGRQWSPSGGRSAPSVARISDGKASEQMKNDVAAESKTSPSHSTKTVDTLANIAPAPSATNGAVNQAFREDDADTGVERKTLKWCESVEMIPHQQSDDGRPGIAVVHDGMLTNHSHHTPTTSTITRPNPHDTSTTRSHHTTVASTAPSPLNTTTTSLTPHSTTTPATTSPYISTATIPTQHTTATTTTTTNPLITTNPQTTTNTTTSPDTSSGQV